MTSTGAGVRFEYLIGWTNHQRVARTGATGGTGNLGRCANQTFGVTFALARGLVKDIALIALDTGPRKWTSTSA